MAIYVELPHERHETFIKPVLVKVFQSLAEYEIKNHGIGQLVADDFRIVRPIMSELQKVLPPFTVFTNARGNKIISVDFQNANH